MGSHWALEKLFPWISHFWGADIECPLRSSLSMEGTVSFCSECGFPFLSFLFFFYLKFFYWRWLLFNIVLVSAIYLHDSATHISVPFDLENYHVVHTLTRGLTLLLLSQVNTIFITSFFCFHCGIMQQINASLLKVQQNQLIHLSWIYILCCCGFREFFFKFPWFGIWENNRIYSVSSTITW